MLRHEACGELLALVDSMSTAVLGVADDGAIVFANERARELAHLAAVGGEDLVGVNVGEWLGPLPALLEAQARESRPTARVEGKTGPRTLGFSIRRVRGMSEAPLHVVTLQDLTQVRALEEERDRLLRLATVGEVMPMLLHETRNPLAAACTLLELLIEERTDPSFQADLHSVLVEIRRSVLMLEGLGTVGRELRASTDQAIDHAILETVGLVEARARNHGVRITARVEPLPLLPLDGASMRGIVLNLLTNAIHACGGGGHVSVSLRRERDTVVLEVRDDGCGMSPEILARCRDTFFTTKRSGSGLGLALCARLVDEAEGTLEIESAPGEGTAVRVIVPGLFRPRVDGGGSDGVPTRPSLRAALGVRTAAH